MNSTLTKKASALVLNLTRVSSLRSLVVMLAGAIAAIACAWSASDDHSVRFNYNRTGRAFYRLPPLPLMYDVRAGKEFSTKQVEDFEYDEANYLDVSDANRPPTLNKQADEVWDRAMKAIYSDNFSETRTLLEKFLTLTHYPTDNDEETRQTRRNTAVDMLDAITAIDKGSKVYLVEIYLDERHAFDGAPATLGGDDALKQSRWDRNLQDNYTYLEGAELYKAGDKENALLTFESLVVNYPRSEKVEAAAYMVAKLKMESSFAFGNLKCGIEGKRRWEDKPIDAEEIEPKEKCQDDAWRAGIESFQNLIRRYPNGRYVDDARGWLAYLYRRGGERAKALAEYYRLLGHPTDLAVRLEAKKSLEMIGHEYDDATLDEVEKLIADDSNAAMAYAYHRIYNQAIDYTYEKRNDYCCWGEDKGLQEVAEDERVDKAVKGGRHELERVTQFATAMLKRYRQARVSGGFLLRIAEANLELQKFYEALTFAKSALSSGVDGDLRAQALWVKGSAEHQRKEFVASKKTFDQLIAEFPKSKYVEGSRRLLAMVAEDRGDLESALEIYIALKYESDVAYFIDVLMPTGRLAKFVENHKNIPQYNQFLYSVGIRYMREKRWTEAREILRRVQTERGVDAYLQADKNATWYFAKEPDYAEYASTFVKTSWVMQDLKTIDIFEHYEQAVEAAQGDEAKAEAMYQQASAFFEADDLVFYNPAAWKGRHAESLAELQFSDHERFSTESQLIFEHLQMHDPWARSIPIYEEIVSRFPQTKVARDAMYSAAVAHERLSERISPWTAIYERGLFAGPRKINYADVKSTYPDYQLPRGTYGWKPSTRTVNGGPGWEPAPKPVPRETREHKAKRLLHEFTDYLSAKITTVLLPNIESKVDSGITWYGSIIEAAIYGVLSAIGVWTLVLVGIGLHSERLRAQLLPEAKEPANADSHVDRFLE